MITDLQTKKNTLQKEISDHRMDPLVRSIAEYAEVLMIECFDRIMAETNTDKILEFVGTARAYKQLSLSILKKLP